MADELETAQTELTASRKMMKGFRLAQDNSNKMIAELKMRNDMLKDELEDKAIAFDKRLNTLIRDFVTVYKKLGAEFTSYKAFAEMEMDVLEAVGNVSAQKIDDISTEVKEFKMAI